MPDRLGDTLANSMPSRHNLICRKCGHVVKGSSALGTRLAMRAHRKMMHPKK
jgi:hypothetical protein